ncbi:MAG: HD domain-containing protein [Thermoguttaceae bacterium]|jgi:HD superfamily phosphohydrolase|nr:HD domain-containing protein [Thermoguttaceae bacterium]
MRCFDSESLSHDPIHGYIPFTSPVGLPEGESAEQDVIDHPWVQRLRQIHQLQTAWWVFPTAEHTRFQHVLGAMHLASRAVEHLFAGLQEVCPDVPSRAYVESLLRMAALLHDVGHGPFGHFFDQHYLADYGLNHETVGAHIIRHELGDMLRRIRRNPKGALAPAETLDPDQIAILITRPHEGEPPDMPQWLRLLRSLFSGLYTVDNMDFVLRDAYMSGYNARAFDLDRLLHYSVFTPRGLTIHERGLSALVRFLSVRAELFRTIYFHRTVRAIDLSLVELFHDSKRYLFPGNPLEHLDEYQRLTEWSLLVRVGAWPQSTDPAISALGQRWREFLARKIRWKMVCERTIVFRPGQSEATSVFSHERLFEAALREQLPPHLKDLPLRFDPARHVHRPGGQAPAAGQNYLFDSATGQIRNLDDREMFRQLPVSYRICRIYAEDHRYQREVAAAMDRLIGASEADDATNM